MFEVFKYPRNPFITILKSNGCYKLCCNKRAGRDRPGYRQQFSKSIDEQKEDFLH